MEDPIVVDGSVLKESGGRVMRLHVERISSNPIELYRTLTNSVKAIRGEGEKYDTVEEISGESWAFGGSIDADALVKVMTKLGLITEDKDLSVYEFNMDLQRVLDIEDPVLRMKLLSSMLAGIILTKKSFMSFLNEGIAPHVGYFRREAQGFFETSAD